MNHEFSVRYVLTDEQVARLTALTIQFNRVMDARLTPEAMLSSILLTGSAIIIDERMSGVRAALDAAECKGGEIG